MLYYFVRVILHIVLIRPIMYLLVGFNVRNPERLPKSGPAIIVSNHNSHLDTMTFETLFPLGFLRKLRPVAAADYFLSKGWLKWLTTKVLRIIPVYRGGTETGSDPLAGCHEALAKGHILIIYPEGSRGEPGAMQKFRKGISWLATQHPEVPVIPICLKGLEKVLPKGSFIPTPFFCDIAVGETMYGDGDRDTFLTQLESTVHALAAELDVQPWK
jgi:1-acyl-sn-glycerol-3-phosphate acyltransferase